MDIRRVRYRRGMTPARQPWDHDGWFVEMSAWIDERLADAGIRRRGAVRQVRAWARAALLTFDTDRGRMWAKAVPEVFAHEVAVTELLADIDPGVVPPVVAADRALGRIITEHVDGPIAGVDRRRPDRSGRRRCPGWPSSSASSPRTSARSRWPASPRRRSDRLADAVPPLLADDELLLVGRPGGLTTGGGADRSGVAVPELVDACRALAASGVPDSLEHGDLAADEVIIGEMGRSSSTGRMGRSRIRSCPRPRSSRSRGAIGRRRGRARRGLPRAVARRPGRLTATAGHAALDAGADRPAAPPGGAVRRAGPARARTPDEIGPTWCRTRCGRSCRE